ncbi:MAG: TraX family protein [Pseudomonadota bacterium]|nr:TraX family protein [Pseudomonadota bacterium]
MKWVGLVAMLIEHVAHFASGMTQGWPFVIGRLAFPLFTVALAVGCAQKTLVELRYVVVRLAAWGVAAGVLGMLVREPVPLNILFTFALGITLHVTLRDTRAGKLMVSAAVLIAAMFVEYGVLGVIAVAIAMHGARHAEPMPRAGMFLLAALLIACVKFNQPAVIAIPALLALAMFPVEVPRLRGFFYVAYAMQWPVIAAVKVAL